jgi:uncharacterized protein (TIGR03067 family)
MNRSRVALGLFLLLALAAWVQADPPNESDPEPASGSAEVEKVQGTWKLINLMRDGARLQPTEFDNMRIIFSENEYSFIGQKGDRHVGTFKLYPRRKPAVLETSYAEEPNEGKTVSRVYQWVNKDTLKICSPGPDERVPDNFEAPQGSGRDLGTWKKIED